MEAQKEVHTEGVENRGKVTEVEKVKELRILGHSLCLKRNRELDSLPSLNSPCSSSNGRVSDDLESWRSAVKAWGNQSLRIADPAMFEMMKKEKQRQYKGIELIASENFVCQAVIEALGRNWLL